MQANTKLSQTKANQWRREHYKKIAGKVKQRVKDWRAANPEKAKELNRRNKRAQYAANPMRFRDAMLRSRYGISQADYERMLEAQGGKCAICTSTPNGIQKRLHVDHDHNTGAVRALLCTPCNTNLGYFEKFQASMLAYLEKHS